MIFNENIKPGEAQVDKLLGHERGLKPFGWSALQLHVNQPKLQNEAARTHGIHPETQCIE